MSSRVAKNRQIKHETEFKLKEENKRNKEEEEEEDDHQVG